MNVHYFGSTAEAYDATQTRDEIADGDILVVMNECVVGILVEAWPTSIETNNTGEFHAVAGPWTQLDGGKYAASYALAHRIRFGEEV